MRRHITIAFSLLFVAIFSRGGNATTCQVQSSLFLNESSTFTCPMNPNDGTQVSFTKTQRYHLHWPGPAYAGKNPVDVDVIAIGKARTFINGGNQHCRNCFPEFLNEINLDRYWAKEVEDMDTITIIDENSVSCDFTPRNVSFNPQAPVCACSPSSPPPQGLCPPGYNTNWNEVYCQWECQNGTPIIIDLDNNGYDLTSAANGVRFDLGVSGALRRWSWTSRGSDDAFLALDHNNNGRIDNGGELFGNYTAQPESPEPNGFIALAVFDQNGDQWIDNNDAIYDSLRLWVDSNHNGRSESSEFRTLIQEGIEGISTAYQISRQSDQYGNRFRWRARVRGQGLGRWAWDVILVSQ